MQECENAFNKLKRTLNTAPLLAHFDHILGTRIYTDASNEAVAAVLCNYDPETKEEHPVQYFSRKLKPTQKSFSVSEKEFYALVTALNRWREFCLGRKVHVFTDHSALQFYQNFKGSSSRLTRLALRVVDYDIEIHYKAGKTLTLPDYLSRNPVTSTEKEQLTDIELETLNTLIHVDVEKMQKEDPDLNRIISAINNPENSSRKDRANSQRFKIFTRILYRRKPGENKNYTLVIPTSLKGQIMKDYHDDLMSGGHLNADKTFDKIKDKYYWCKMRTDIIYYVRFCDSCQKRTIPPRKPFGFLQPVPPTLKPFTCI